MDPRLPRIPLLARRQVPGPSNFQLAWCTAFPRWMRASLRLLSGAACTPHHKPRAVRLGTPGSEASSMHPATPHTASPARPTPSGRCVGGGETPPPAGPVQPLVRPFPARLPVCPSSLRVARTLYRAPLTPGASLWLPVITYHDLGLIATTTVPRSGLADLLARAPRDVL